MNINQISIRIKYDVVIHQTSIVFEIQNYLKRRQLEIHRYFLGSSVMKYRNILNWSV